VPVSIEAGERGCQRVELLHLPFFAEIQDAQNILVAGAGGGFDLLMVIHRFQASLPAVREWRGLPM
jgi:hypothetical protein